MLMQNRVEIWCSLFCWISCNQFIKGCMGRNCLRAIPCEIGIWHMLLCCGLAGVLWDLRWKRFFVPPGSRQAPSAIRVGSGEALGPLQSPRQCRVRWPRARPTHSEAHGELGSERMVANRGWRCRRGDGEPEGCSHHRQEELRRHHRESDRYFLWQSLEGRYVQRPRYCAGFNSTNYTCTQVHPADGGHGETKQLGLQRKTFPLEQPLVTMSPSHFAVCFSIFQEHLSETRTIFSPSLLGWTCWTQGITRPQAGAVWVRQLKEDRSDRCQSVAPPRKHYWLGSTI